jgi:hypothetical protein
MSESTPGASPNSPDNAKQPVELSEDADLRCIKREVEIRSAFEAEYANTGVDLTAGTALAINHDMPYASGETTDRYWGFRDGYNIAMEKTLIKRESSLDIRNALKQLTTYVQEQAAQNNLDWGLLAKNQVLVNALKALGEINEPKRNVIEGQSS